MSSLIVLLVVCLVIVCVRRRAPRLPGQDSGRCRTVRGKSLADLMDREKQNGRTDYGDR